MSCVLKVEQLLLPGLALVYVGNYSFSLPFSGPGNASRGYYVLSASSSDTTKLRDGFWWASFALLPQLFWTFQIFLSTRQLNADWIFVLLNLYFFHVLSVVHFWIIFLQSIYCWVLLLLLLLLNHQYYYSFLKM
jgi:hypothetical protein